MDRADPAAALYISSVLLAGKKVWAAPISKLFFSLLGFSSQDRAGVADSVTGG